jgi:DNA-binding NarL/FixJ family response regulator
MLIQEIGLKLAESMSRSELEKRETQVLHYLALGRSNKEIGRALHISEGTVKHHVKSILYAYRRDRNHRCLCRHDLRNLDRDSAEQTAVAGFAAKSAA